MNIRTKLTFVLLLLSIGVIAGVGIISSLSVDAYFRSRILDELRREGDQIETLLYSTHFDESGWYPVLQRLAAASRMRLTLVDSAGTVLFDSDVAQEAIGSVENHLHRPEVEQAMQIGSGTDTRHSTTVDQDFLYYAKRVHLANASSSQFQDVATVRLAVPLTEIQSVLREVHSAIIVTGVIVFALVIVVAIVLSRKLAQPLLEISATAEHIRSGDLSQRIPIRGNDEYASLARTLNGMVDKLNEDIVKLRKLERVRSEFLGNVSHELRTPIFAIQGMLETLLNGALTDDPTVSRSFVERALHNTQRLNALLGDLIEISHIESGEMKMSFRYFALKEFLDGVIAEMQPVAEQKNISLLLQPPAVDAEVLGDKERLRQVMFNLIDNAIKYTPAGGRVSVSAEHKNGTVKISVQDSGVGIAKEYLGRIFERFYRVDRERSREAGGTGLGLAIVKHIIEAHESKMDVESEIGRGSTFSFMLRS